MHAAVTITQVQGCSYSLPICCTASYLSSCLDIDLRLTIQKVNMEMSTKGIPLDNPPVMYPQLSEMHL